MAEFLTMSEAEEKFGSKGKTNAALTTGIIGTAGAALGILSGLGAAHSKQSGSPTPSLWEICEKQGAENVALTRAIYEGRIQTMKDMADVYERLNTRLVDIEKKDAALEASLPLAMQLASVNAERYADNKVANAAEKQSGVNFNLQREVDKRIVGTMGLPWGDIITGVPKMPNCALDVTCTEKGTSV